MPKLKASRRLGDAEDDASRDDASQSRCGTRRAEAAGQACPNGGLKSDGLERIDQVCTDDLDALALAVLRFVAAAAMTSDAACWDAAFDHAEREVGHEAAPAFVGAMAGLMRALRIERVAAWRFLPATCCRLTGDEKELMQLLGAVGRNEADVLRLARRITGAALPERLLVAVEPAARAIGELREARNASEAMPVQGVLH